ncbi:phosphotransferase [Longispora albida]|uniref:phosphotransferase n=1 Tax=Longispora albida TaxID=203523 RepID=UPI000362EABE|nr:phosphotransferase [Longispora albida]
MTPQTDTCDPSRVRAEALACLRALAGEVDGLVVGDEVLHHTDKAIVTAGALRGQPVVVKLLTSGDGHWRARREHEVRVYAGFAADPPAVTAPRLLCDHAGALTVVSRLSGVRLGEHRFLDHDPGPAVATRLLKAMRAVAAWRPGWAPPGGDREAIDREHGLGHLSATDAQAAAALLERCPAPVFAHGDVLPTNILLTDTGVQLVDWEHADWLLPGYDLALLDLVAGTASPPLREAIATEVHQSQLAAAFAVNLALLTAREIRLHTALPEHAPERARRLTLLVGQAARASRLLRDLL